MSGWEILEEDVIWVSLGYLWILAGDSRGGRLIQPKMLLKSVLTSEFTLSLNVFPVSRLSPLCY